MARILNIIPLDPMGDYADNAMSVTSYTPKMYPAYSYVNTTLGRYFGYQRGVLKDLYAGVTFVMPFDGYWRMIGDSYGIPEGELAFEVYHLGRDWSSAIFAGTTISIISGFIVTYSYNTDFKNIFFRAAIEVKPFAYNPNGFTAPIGGSGSRLANTGINVMGSDNTVYENVSFVDETNNTFYNPSTNTTTSFTDWTYDYSTREYTLTTTDNTQVTIRYGDDSVTIKQGDTIVNNYYYAVPDVPVPTPEPTPPPAPTAHVHSWLRLQEASFAATCTTDGKDEYYCSDSACTETHTVNSAAGGHIWVGTGYVPIEYDDEGNVISSQDYTDYKCLTCNERYRQYDGQPPPSGGSGSGHNGSGNIFEIMFSLLADFFRFFVNLLLDFIPNSLRDFFSSITDSSSDVFGIFNRGGQSNGEGAGRP